RRRCPTRHWQPSRSSSSPAAVTRCTTFRGGRYGRRRCSRSRWIRAACSHSFVSWLRERHMTARRFVISCQHCKRIVALTQLITDAPRDQLRAHLLACCPNGVGGYAPDEVTLRHFRVVPTESDEPPPG